MRPDLELTIRWKTAAAAALVGLTAVALASCGQPGAGSVPSNAAAPTNAAAAAPAAPGMNAGPAAPAPAGTGRWDSIAVDDARGSQGGAAGYGVGTATSPGGAQAEAMVACQKAGNNNCVVKLTYTACGAYASSTTTFGTGTGDTAQQARASALANCGDAAACQLSVSDCVGQ